MIELALLNGDCSQHDPETWFSERRSLVNEAKRICSGCPELMRCQTNILELEFETNHIQYGIYGGLTETERRKYNRQRQKRRGA